MIGLGTGSVKGTVIIEGNKTLITSKENSFILWCTNTSEWIVFAVATRIKSPLRHIETTQGPYNFFFFQSLSNTHTIISRVNG